MVLERLWRTGEILFEKPDVNTERQNVLHYLHTIFPDVLPMIDRRLEKAWRVAGFAPEIITDPCNLPRLSFASWIGDDRDGHPLVTAETTRETLQEMRRHAIRLVRNQLEQFVSKLSISGRFQSPTGAMEKRMELSQAQKDELHRRVTEHRAAPSTVVPWEQLRARLFSEKS